MERLNNGKVYFTEEWQQKFTHAAHENMQWEIKQLEVGCIPSID